MRTFSKLITEAVFTRQHYQAVADILSRRRRPVGNKQLTMVATVEGIANDLADFFEKDNPMFDRDRFMAAVQRVPTRPVVDPNQTHDLGTMKQGSRSID